MFLEQRYVVLKQKDIRDAGLTDEEMFVLGMVCGKVDRARHKRGVAPLECIVVEADWPEFGSTWASIKSRGTPPELKAKPCQHCNPAGNYLYGDRVCGSCRGDGYVPFRTTESRCAPY